ncbi:hypothetical protein [Chryseobacterium indoltheticum]|uniref:hypothetical protein n=1 Tax=Chryseobacterium indoltheticum TaxID=254 RepID=UPI003F498DC9
MIPAGISANSQFITYKGNKNGARSKDLFHNKLLMIPVQFGFNALQANSLGFTKSIYFDFKSTASASEIVINNLKPYMEVIQVGDVTLVKRHGCDL